MHIFSIVFLAALVFTTLFRAWLATRQIHFVLSHRREVPGPFKEKVSLQEHQKAADYTISKVRLGRWELLVDVLVVLGFTFGGGLEWIDQLLRAQSLGWIGTAIGLAAFTTLVSGVIGLPFTIYSTFVIEQKFGFNRMTPALFIKDMIKSALLGAAVGLPLFIAIIWIMESLGQSWWFYAWLVVVAFSLLAMVVFPIWIAPMFNKFSPLTNDALKTRIENLLSKCGFKSQGLFVMDGSKRSSHGNAYFTGLGKSKRIVFFDTLIERLQPDEIEAVLAHELGHFKRKHVLKRILLTFFMSLIFFALLGWLINQSWFFEGLGVSQRSSAMALILFSMILPFFTFPLKPVSSLYSRKHEFEADEYAAQQTDGKDLINALVKLYQDNASTLTPDPLYSAIYDSHPPAAIRINHLRQLAGT